ncbi:hypothetical protein NL391_27860, partial [Klebsiella pneumoniae]|nr:hypothetical protein [Klebsiella pneumoniae]
GLPVVLQTHQRGAQEEAIGRRRSQIPNLYDRIHERVHVLCREEQPRDLGVSYDGCSSRNGKTLFQQTTMEDKQQRIV